MPMPHPGLDWTGGGQSSDDINRFHMEQIQRVFALYRSDDTLPFLNDPICIQVLNVVDLHDGKTPFHSLLNAYNKVFNTTIYIEEV